MSILDKAADGSLADKLAVAIITVAVMLAGLLIAFVGAIIVEAALEFAPWLLGLVFLLAVFWAAHRVVRLSRD